MEYHEANHQLLLKTKDNGTLLFNDVLFFEQKNFSIQNVIFDMLNFNSKNIPPHIAERFESLDFLLDTMPSMIFSTSSPRQDAKYSSLAITKYKPSADFARPHIPPARNKCSRPLDGEHAARTAPPRKPKN